MNKIDKNKRGFTIAEVLITLTIIGVISLLTIPTLKKYSSKHAFVAQLKKDYSTLNNVLDYALADDVTIDIDEIGGTVFFTDYLLPKFNSVKICKGSADGCFASNISGLTSAPTNAVILADGSAIGNNDMVYTIDINGPELPNIVGADIFEYELIQVKADYQLSNNVVPISKSNSLLSMFFDALTPQVYAAAGNIQRPNEMFSKNDRVDLDGGGSGSSGSGFSSGSSSSKPSFGGSSSSSSSSSGSSVTSGTSSGNSSSNSFEDTSCMKGHDCNDNPGPEDDDSSSGSIGSGTTGSTGSGTTGSTGSGTTGSTGFGSAGSGSSSSGSNTFGVMDDSSVSTATNPEGWRFVPLGKTADIMNNNWKIDKW